MSSVLLDAVIRARTEYDEKVRATAIAEQAKAEARLRLEDAVMIAITNGIPVEELPDAVRKGGHLRHVLEQLARKGEIDL